MDEYRKYEPIFGAWYLGRLIGKGSFGKVFEITREEFGVTYKAALKVISVPQDDEDIKARLAEGTDPKTLYDEILKEIVNENIIMSRLKGNSNIVSYEDHQIIPHEDGIGYDILIRMELLTPLIDRMMRGKLDEGEVLKLGIDICKALEICHRKNIIHRDIKPQNIFISDNGDYKLGDFGIARTIEKTTGGMSNKGTYKYMAPEVFKGEDYDSTVDIYSLGIVLYTLLNGNRGPFLPPPPAKVTHSDEEEARMRRFRGEPIPEPENAGPMLVYIIHKACANDPSDRYQTAAQMRRDLEDYQRSYIPADEMTVSTDDATTPLFAGEKSSANRGSAAAVPYGAAGSATAGSYAAAGSATAGSYAAAGSATAGSYAAAGSAADKSGAAAAEKEKHASLEDILKQHKLIAVIAGSVAGTAFLVFLICILILQIAPDSGLAVGIDSFIEAVTGGVSDYDGGDDAYPDPDTYDAYLAVLEENSEGIRSYWWQKDIYDRCPNEAEGIPMTDPQNRCVAVADIFGDSEPELMYFDAAGGEKAYLNLCSSMNGEPEWLDYDASAGSYAGNAAPWGDGFFADNRDADTKYMIYTGKGADTFYIVSSMRDRLTYFCSVKYVVEDSITIRAESYVVNTYGPKEDDSGILDKYYVNGSEVSSKEGVAAFEAAADDFDDLIMLSGSDKENLKVFKRGETEKQAAAAYYEAVSSLQSKEKTAWSDPPEKPAVPENEYTVVTKDGVIVREGPGRQYRALRRTELNDEYIGRSLEGERACLKQGSKVISLGITGDWMEISAGWICITYKGESLVRKSSEL